MTVVLLIMQTSIVYSLLVINDLPSIKLGVTFTRLFLEIHYGHSLFYPITVLVLTLVSEYDH